MTSASRLTATACPFGVLALLIGMVLPLPTAGQVVDRSDMPSVPEMLAEFERAADAGARRPSPDYPVAAWVPETIDASERYSPARVDSLLDGLQELASRPDGPAQTDALVWLHRAGEHRTRPGGIVRRMAAVYRSAVLNGDSWTQETVLWLMTFQGEVDAARDFLESVAAEGGLNLSWLVEMHLRQMGFREGDPEPPPVPLVLAGFEEAAEEGHGTGSRLYPLAGVVFEALFMPDRTSAARHDSIVDGLQELATTAPAGATRTLAVIDLSMAGDRTQERPLPGAVRRLAAIYRATLAQGRTDGHRIILGMMPQQAESDEALAFLESVVVEAESSQAFIMAFQGLRQMGDVGGDEVLRRLYETGALTDPWKREELRRLIEDDSAPNG